MNCVKFISRCVRQSFVEKCKISRCTLHNLKFQFFCTAASNKFEALLEDEEFLKKIVYNEILYSTVNSRNNRSVRYTPVCLKYLNPENKETKGIKNENVETESEIAHFPFEVKESDENNANNATETFVETVETFTPSDHDVLKVPQWKSENYYTGFRNIENPQKWIFEHKNTELEDAFMFGSCNPNSTISSVPCGGCGALLHCVDPKLPGFIPAELFESTEEKNLKSEKCQRCHFLKEFNVSLGLNVSPSEYENLIRTIKDKKALVIIMIDILDFPCSIFPGIFDLIGLEKPVVIVANKVDLLIQEGPSFAVNIKKSLIHSLKKQKINLNNVKHVELISAKTGYGIERLIDVLFSNWGNKGDIYLIGCTNVGKSSLFNTLIQSDFCKVKAINLLQRATVSAWPGTTLNLLKFPIMKPKEWHLYARSKRLFFQYKEESAFKTFQSLGQKINLEQIPLQEYVGRTFLNKEDPHDSGAPDDPSNDVKREGMDPNVFTKSCWFYDTPGVVQQDQIVNFLTAPELLLTVPKKMLLPRNFCLKPGSSLFIAGLARLDYVSGGDGINLTVYASMELPLTVTKIKDAEEVYQRLLGTPYFRVPVSGKERLAKWPRLSSKKFEIDSKIYNIWSEKQQKNEKLDRNADVDIVLSSAGWAALTLPFGQRCLIEAWTLKGRGIHLRNHPLIKNGYAFKGPKIPGTPAFVNEMKEVKKYSFTEIPEDEF